VSAHTPGPWLIDDDGQWFAICADNHCIAQVHTPNSASLDRQAANARLIAAAPELFAELSHLVRLLEVQEQSGRLNVPGLATLNGARAALAKVNV
jgi:hypothetical protein